MNHTTPPIHDWLQQSPRGTLLPMAMLKNRTWLKVGGKASYLFVPEDQEDLQNLIRQYPQQAPLMCLGLGTNILIRDGGVDALVVHLGKGFADITRLDEHRILVGAGVRSQNLAKQAADWGLGGLGFLAGIPGSVGGALMMNAGAHGGVTYDHLQAVHWLDRQGNLQHIPKQDIDHSYRHTQFAQNIFDGGIIVAAIFCCPHQQTKQLHQEIVDIRRIRRETQPTGVHTGGSTFKNPTEASPVNGQIKSAWQWIDAAGCRGARLGGAMVNDLHCNFLINTGLATAQELEQLAEQVRSRVQQQFGIVLEWEIRRIGQASSGRVVVD